MNTAKKKQTSPDRYFDRELSWLDFNWRVLWQAQNPTHPLLERIKFLAITGSNLDEFFKVRVGSLTLLAARAVEKDETLASSVHDALVRLRERAGELYRRQYAILVEDLLPALEVHDIRRLKPADMKPSQVEFLRRQFHDLIGSVISPIGVSADREFPLLAGAPLCIGVSIKKNSFTLAPPQIVVGDAESISDAADDRQVVIPLGRSLNRLWTLPSDSGFHYVLLEDIVTMFLAEMFPDQEISESVVFRVTRNADLEVDEIGVVDLLDEIEHLLQARRVSDCVRLEIDADASPRMREFLRSSLKIDATDIVDCPGPMDLSAFMRLTQIQGHAEIKDVPWPPQPSPEFPKGANIFELIAERDRLLFHPYQSYEPVVEWIRAAAADPDVLAIKQTLYRTSRNSAIVAALADAAQAGKSVTAVVELKARFDEARNIAWARQLEAAGVDVVYGLRGLKVHAKLCVVVRRELSGIRRYLHIGTGNYNEVTAKLYSDLSYFTVDPQTGDDAIKFFNAIAGFSAPLPMQKLTMAPIGLRDRLMELIEVEAEAARAGAPARIDIKINSLVDRQIIEAFYAASCAGVQINLNVRGICCLRPQVKDLSENIRVVSVVDRFLEHARIFRFHHQGDDLVMLGSSDLMPRNLDRRVELMVRIDDDGWKAELIAILDCYFRDNCNAYELKSDGSYVPIRSSKKTGQLRAQQVFHQRYKDRYEESINPQTKIFQPVRGSAGST